MRPRIPAHIKQRAAQLIAGGLVERETVRKVLQANAARRIEFEVGDAKQDDFYPQFKTKHWDNECNFSARLVAGQGAVTEHDGKLAYDDGEQVARFYEKDTGDEDGGFEFDIVLPRKPKTNVFRWTLQHKGLDFFYQPPLTEEEKAQGAHRPENVEGSYAVYHKTGRNNRVGGKEYRTGKAFHIYRPYAEDATGRRVWCDLHIDSEKNEMTVTVPRAALRNAVYPVIIDPTFGYTSIGASTPSGIRHDQDDGSTTLYALAEDGDVTKITAYLFDNSGATDAKGTIHANNSGNPGAIQGATLPTSVSSIGWYDLNFSTPVSLTAGSYWLGFVSGGNYVYVGAFDSGASNRFSNEGINYTTPGSFTVSSSWDRRISIYATYTASGPTQESATASLDALIAENLSVTTTTDALIYEQPSHTATVDAFLKERLSTGATLDALTKERLSASVTVDGLILDRANATATLDALLRARLTQTATVDSFISAPSGGCARPLRQADGTLLLQANGEEICIAGAAAESVSTTVDALIKAQASAESTLDALILDRRAAVATLDALIYQQGTDTASVDALVRARESLSANLDALIRERATATATVDGFIKEIGQATASIDAFVAEENAGAVTATVDGVVRAANSTLASLDALIAETLSASSTVDAMVVERLAASATLDAVVKARETVSTAVDGLVLAQEQATATVDAVVSEALSASATLDAVVAEELTASATLDAVIRAQTATTASLDALIAERRTLSATLDGFIFEQGALVDPYCPADSPYCPADSPYSAMQPYLTRPAKQCA